MAAAAVMTAGVAAYDEVRLDELYSDTETGFILRGGFGASTIEAREKVFASTTGDNLLSLLVWKTTAPIASFDAKARLGDDWTLRGRIDAAFGGDSHMSDYDWFGPHFLSYDPDDWTHRSLHPNTGLDWYFNGEVTLAKVFPANQHFSGSVGVGLKYTDVKWSARGGSFIYSDAQFGDGCGFRGCAWSDPSNQLGIDYRVQLPTAFLSFDSTYNNGPWVVTTGGKVGTTFMASATDNHHLRFDIGPKGARDEFALDMSLSVGAEARVGYAFTDQLSGFVEATYDRTMSGHVDRPRYNAATGELADPGVGIGGLDLQTMTLKAGLKGAF